VLTSVGLKNFKSFREERVKLGMRSLLVGPNMSGKSNFISAFRFIQQVCFPEPGVWGLPSAIPGPFGEFTWKGEESNLMVISLEGLITTTSPLQADEWRYEISILGDERRNFRVQDERLAISSSSGRVSELIQQKNGSRVLVNIAGNEVMSSLDANRASLEFEIPDWDGSFLRRSIATWHFYQLSPARMRGLNSAAAPRQLAREGDNLSAWLLALQTMHSDAFGKIQHVCSDLLPDVERLFTQPTQQATVSLVSRERFLKRPVPVWQMSDGELVFLALVSLIYCPPEFRASLYCIEEPENHLHPKLIETLIELLKQVQAELGPSRAAQVIATTHSPHLVDKAGIEELLVFQKHEGATHITYPRDKAHLRDLLQSQELGLGDLFYSGALQGG
jgi:predicted ATPase